MAYLIPNCSKPQALSDTRELRKSRRKNAIINQETFNGTRKEITDEVIPVFNETYEKVISVVKIANNFYKTDKVKQQLFSFSKVSATLNSQKVI